MDAAILVYFIFSVNIKLQNHLVYFALTFMNSTGEGGEVGEENMSSYTFVFYGASGSNTSTRFGEALVLLKGLQIYLLHFIYLM